MLNGNGVPNVSWTYDEGKYFDLWMIVHFLTGTVIGIGAHLLGFNALVAYTGTFVGLALYEVVEDVFGVEETVENRLTDIVFGYVGFAPLYAFVSPNVSLFVNQLLFVIAGLAVMLASVFGWHAYKKRTE